MKTIATVLLVTALGFGSGCARSDWIEQTLVTVDVTGTWQSTEGGFVELQLEQQGPKVTGSIVIGGLTGRNRISGPIEGTVAGDVLRFRQRHDLEGEMTLSGDEMSGDVRWSPGADPAARGRRSVLLRRVTASPPPSTRQP